MCVLKQLKHIKKYWLPKHTDMGDKLKEKQMQSADASG